MKKLLAVLAVGGMLMAIPSQSEAQVGVRLGVSSVSGLVGVEYQSGNISGAVGYLRGDELRIPISVRYSLNTEGNTLWAAASFITNNDVGYTADNWTAEWYSTIGATVGYNMELGEALDLSLGAGYGVHTGMSEGALDAGLVNEAESGMVLIDLSLGYNF